MVAWKHACCGSGSRRASLGFVRPFGKPPEPGGNLEANGTKIWGEIAGHKEDGWRLPLRPRSGCFQTGCWQGYQVGISFDNLDHSWLRKIIQQRVNDGGILRLIINHEWRMFFPCVGPCLSIVQKHLHYHLEIYTFYRVDFVTKPG